MAGRDNALTSKASTVMSVKKKDEKLVEAHAMMCRRLSFEQILRETLI